MSEKRVRGNVPNTNCEAFSPMTYIYTLRPCSVWKGLKRFERDWRGLNPLQVKILLKPPQSPSIPVARGLSEHGLKMFYKMSVKGGNVKKKKKNSKIVLYVSLQRISMLDKRSSVIHHQGQNRRPMRTRDMNQSTCGR